MRKEIDLNLDLSLSKSVLLDHHSLLNLLNVLQYELEALLKKTDHELVVGYKDFVVDLLFMLGEKTFNSRISKIEDEFCKFADDLRKFKLENNLFESQAEILLDIIEVAIVQLSEFKANRLEWKEIPVSEIKNKLVSFLNIIESVSRQRFHFVYAPNEPGSSDYFIKLDIADNSEILYSPSIIHDLIRDLVANSRKYSKPGSNIEVKLHQIERNGISLLIEDEGMGIPKGEINNVVKFQHRASNVKEIRSMGKGFGLTKAYHVCKLFNGKFIINSELNKGTAIELTMYPPSTNGRKT